MQDSSLAVSRCWRRHRQSRYAQMRLFLGVIAALTILAIPTERAQGQSGNVCGLMILGCPAPINDVQFVYHDMIYNGSATPIGSERVGSVIVYSYMAFSEADGSYIIGTCKLSYWQAVLPDGTIVTPHDITHTYFPPGDPIVMNSTPDDNTADDGTTYTDDWESSDYTYGDTDYGLTSDDIGYDPSSDFGVDDGAGQVNGCNLSEWTDDPDNCGEMQAFVAPKRYPDLIIDKAVPTLFIRRSDENV